MVFLFLFSVFVLYSPVILPGDVPLPVLETLFGPVSASVSGDYACGRACAVNRPFQGLVLVCACTFAVPVPLSASGPVPMSTTVEKPGPMSGPMLSTVPMPGQA
jgi:hypothetical protein